MPHLAELALDEIAPSTPPQLRRVVFALRSQPSDMRNLEEWSEVANAPSRTLARVFRAETTPSS